jgi:hypothetical protein
MSFKIYIAISPIVAHWQNDRLIILSSRVLIQPLAQAAKRRHNIKYNDTQHNDIQNNDSQHKGLIYDTRHSKTLPLC